MDFKLRPSSAPADAIGKLIDRLTNSEQETALNPRFNEDSDLQAVLKGSALEAGSKGDGVLKVQSALADLGFYAGDKLDGAFGRQTATAVKNFQSSQKLPQTGRVDAKTLQALSKVVPEAGAKIWQQSGDQNLIPSNLLENGKRARAVVDLSEHRLFLFEEDSDKLKKVYSVATGNPNHPDGKGIKSTPGVKVVTSKNADPTEVANRLWPETKGKAFGTRLIDLSHQDPVTKEFKRSGVELHGTYARNSIGTDASHGCMRMLNEDIEEVFSELKKGDNIIVQD